MYQVGINFAPASATHGDRGEGLLLRIASKVHLRGDNAGQPGALNRSNGKRSHVMAGPAETAGVKDDSIANKDTVIILGSNSALVADESIADSTDQKRNLAGPGQLGPLSVTFTDLNSSKADSAAPLKEVVDLPPSVWDALQGEDKSAAARLMVESWVAYFTARRNESAWNGPREAFLLAHLKGADKNDSVEKLFQTELSEAKHRAALVEQRVAMAKAVKEQFEAWTKLGLGVPTFLGWTVGVSLTLTACALVLVWFGKLNGPEVALLAFVFALLAVSPATLLLLGRPLKGIDNWDPNALLKGDKPDAATKNKENQSKTGTGSNTDVGKTPAPNPDSNQQGS